MAIPQKRIWLGSTSFVGAVEEAYRRVRAPWVRNDGYVGRCEFWRGVDRVHWVGVDCAAIDGAVINVKGNAVDWLQVYGKELVSLLVPVITAIIRVAFRPAVKLNSSVAHKFTFLIQEPRFDQAGVKLAETQSMVVQSTFTRNTGKAVAEDLEIVFNWKPFAVNVWPVRQFTETTLEDRRYILTFPTLAPRETVGVEALVINSEMPQVTLIRCRQGETNWIRTQPWPIVPLWKIRIAQALMLLGLGLLVYFVLVVLQYLIVVTPLVSRVGSSS
ncbi:MAG TPA: hypothetical protein VHB46_16550 [Burkholderiales bacterium]|nr:hypothetical protein [Burkholderiales bacterium]